MATLRLLVLSGGLLLSLAACAGADRDIEGNCQPALGDDPDCIIDGECAAECLLDGSCTTGLEPVGVDDGDLLDRDDPDCDPCIYDDDSCIWD